MSLKREASKVRKIIKNKCPTLSVKMGKGTARDWVDIQGSKDRYGRFTSSEKRCLTRLGIKTGLGGGTSLDQKDKKRLIKRFR